MIDSKLQRAVAKTTISLQKMKFFVKDLIIKCEQIQMKAKDLCIFTKEILMVNFYFM